MATRIILILIIATHFACFKGETPALNRLANAGSPYLKQHADNPVDWHPWGAEAFALARRLDKPIFLSIGYSSCHWCHVMEEESFKNLETAKLMNDTFVNILVDKEERPDINRLYIKYSMAMTGQAGWPLNIIMTPDKRPIFAASYMSPRSAFGRIGMIDLMGQMRKNWKEKRQELLKGGLDIQESVRKAARPTRGRGVTAQDLNKARIAMLGNYDRKFGGFGRGAKFPEGSRLLFLLRSHALGKDPASLQAARVSLLAMGAGGIFDQIGFGFHRYAGDRRWRLPHFEKMLYDQALLARVYLEAFQITGEPRFARTAREIFEFVLRDMTSAQGAFFSALDADSEGEEGRFYLWKLEELNSVLGAGAGAVFRKSFNVRPEGNFLDPLSRTKNGWNVLFRNFAAGGTAGGDKPHLGFEKQRRALLAFRARRPQPFRDEKILTDWNALMSASLAYGGRVLGERKYTRAAARNLDWLLKNMAPGSTGGKKQLFHSFQNGKPSVPGFLEDYSALVLALLELYEAEFDPKYLRGALELQVAQDRLFLDRNQGGYFSSPQNSKELDFQQKTILDRDFPAGNSLSLLNLIRLANMTGNMQFLKQAEAMNHLFSNSVLNNPANHGFYFCALQTALHPGFEIVVAGDSTSPDTRKMLEALHNLYLPRSVILLRNKNGSDLAELAPFTRSQKPVKGRATAYVCKNFQCKFPTTDLNQMLHYLTEQ